MDRATVIPVRTSTKQAIILPDSHIKLMPAESQNALRDIRQRIVNTTSQMSVDSTIPEFFENLSSLLTGRVAYREEYQQYLIEVKIAQALGNEEYQEAMDESYKDFLEDATELKFLARGRRAFEQDFEEMEQEQKPKRTYISLWEEKMMYLSNCYLPSIRPRDRKFGQRLYRNGVMRYLNSRRLKPQKMVWCHLTGWRVNYEVKVACRLVPRTLGDHELAALFGSEVPIARDVRNSLILQSAIEEALDNGTIAIVPIPTPPNTGTRWVCLLVDQSKKDVRSCYSSKGSVRWRDLDQKELTFRSGNRPARRYLFFRFIMTYLYAKWNGDIECAELIEQKMESWATSGAYVRRSALRALVRNFSGVDLPPSFLDKTTFVSKNDNYFTSEDEFAVESNDESDDDEF